jgi:hypothetical protein
MTIAGLSNTRRPWYQSVLLGLLAVGGAFSALGTILDAVANAEVLVTPAVTYIGTALVFFAGLILELILRFHPLDWVAHGQRVRLKRLSIGAWLSLLGMIILLWIPRVRALQHGDELAVISTPTPALWLDQVQEVSRKPIWDVESFDEDEVVVKAAVRRTPDPSSTSAIVAFWRPATGFVTSWHAGRRRNGGNWKLATLDVSTLSASDASDFLIGGIECEKNYDGEIALILLEIPRQVIEKESDDWIDDENGWGFESLPRGAGVRTTRTLSFRTSPTRS